MKPTTAELALTVQPPPNNYPYHIVARWRGSHWKINAEGYSSPESSAVAARVAELASNGWSYIHVIKLPELP